jgi:ubiquinone/menaquinone biosynthesis C-methylase UbiE
MIKTLMKIFPNFPSENNYDNWEIFNHDNYLKSSEENKEKIRRASCIARYNIEKDIKFSWMENYFLKNLSHVKLENKSLLDIGCFTGGRLIAWSENYKLKKIFGIDINPIFKKAGEEFAKEKNIDAEFETGVGEKLPYMDSSFDFVVSTDTFEHVQNLELSIDECFRVLKPGGMLLAVFPQYLQPFESHLNFVTNLPCLHWFFNSKKISEKYFEILNERGESAKWYRGEKKKLDTWEKLPTLNGTSIRIFENILKINNWSNIKWVKKPILTDGRRSKKIIFRLLSLLFYPLIHIKYLDELFMSRICVICKK